MRRLDVHPHVEGELVDCVFDPLSLDPSRSEIDALRQRSFLTEQHDAGAIDRIPEFQDGGDPARGVEGEGASSVEIAAFEIDIFDGHSHAQYPGARSVGGQMLGNRDTALAL